MVFIWNLLSYPIEKHLSFKGNYNDSILIVISGVTSAAHTVSHLLMLCSKKGQQSVLNLVTDKNLFEFFLPMNLFCPYCQPS